MAPRKSVPRAPRPSQSSSKATSSKVTLDDIPPADIPMSITPEYAYQPRARHTLSESEKEKMVHELVGFFPRQVCDDITNNARDEIITAIGGIDSWASSKITDEDEDEMQREVNIGLYAAESLLESRIDREFDKFTAWMLRNPFDFRGDRDYVLPWQAGLDFKRGEHVAALPRGQGTLDERLEDLRTKMEQARMVSQRLEQAEKMLERRLEVAKQRKAEVGFVNDVLASSGLSPLDKTANSLSTSLKSLHTLLEPLEPPHPTSFQSTSPYTGTTSSVQGMTVPGGAKAWEMGRQAYLNWAVGKLVSASSAGRGGSGQGMEGGGGGGAGSGGEGVDEVLEGVERDMRAAGGGEGVERLASAAGGGV